MQYLVFLCLAHFIKHNGLKFHPCCCRWQDFLHTEMILFCMYLIKQKSIKTNFTCFFWRFHVALRLTCATCITFMVDSVTLEPCRHISPWPQVPQGSTSKIKHHLLFPTPLHPQSFFDRVAQMSFFHQITLGKVWGWSFLQMITFWLCWVSVAVCLCTQHSLAAASRGCSPLQCEGFSLPAASLVEHRLQALGLQ